MSNEPPSMPAGWYPDPEGGPAPRWWDGAQWAEATGPGTPSAPHPSTPGRTKRGGWKKWALIGGGVLVVLIVIGALTSGGDDDDDDVAVEDATTLPSIETTTTDAVSTSDAPATTAAPEVTTTEPPTTTAAPTTTTEPPPSAGERENPIPLGTPVAMGDWSIEPLAVEDATALVAELNQFNDPPADGNAFVRIQFRATFNGQGVGNPGGFPSINVVTPAGGTFREETFIAGGSGGEPDHFREQAETFPGGSVEGWMYYEMPAADAGGALIGFTPEVSYPAVPGGIAFFQIR